MNRKRSRSTAQPAPKALGPTALIETLLGGWRPLSRLDVDGFAILRSRGVTRRANSIVPIDPPQDPQALSAALDRVTALAGATGDPVRFRILPENGHDHVDAALAERGFTIAAPCDILERTPGQKAPVPDPRARIRTGPLPEDWFDAAWHLAPRDGEGARETMHDILAGTPAVHVAIDAKSADGPVVDGPIAVGRAALVERGRTRTAVLNEIAVDSAHRRAGLGTSIVHTLLAAASVQGADHALLEVETDNPAAAALYRRTGFRRIGGYHYRVEA